VRSERPQLLEWHRRSPARREHAVYGASEIRRRVGKRAIEIEEDESSAHAVQLLRPC
jgi:hypothetical protein